MESISLSSSLVSRSKLVYFSNKRSWCMLRKNKCTLLCQSGANVKSSSLSSVLTKRSSVLVKDEHLVPCNETTSWVDMENHGEVGIAKLLRYVSAFFFLPCHGETTGFLAKGMSLLFFTPLSYCLFIFCSNLWYWDIRQFSPVSVVTWWKLFANANYDLGTFFKLQSECRLLKLSFVGWI